MSLVKLDVQAALGHKLIADLTQDDFLVLDEGQPAPIVYFGREAEPLWVLLLLDVSGSMRRRLKEMAAASRRALAALRPGDRVAIMLFSRNTALHTPFTADPAAVSTRIGSALEEKGLGSGTQINLSVIAAADHLAKILDNEPGRRAIVILTDNAGLNYQAPDEDVLRSLYKADAVLNAIVTPDAKPPKPLDAGRYVNPDFTPPDVFHLANSTGGDVARASNAGDAFQRMMESIRTRYSLHCHAAEGPSGTFRRIQVQLTAEARRRYPRAELRARAGYYLP